jgi:hypothetical protein
MNSPCNVEANFSDIGWTDTSAERLYLPLHEGDLHVTLASKRSPSLTMHPNPRVDVDRACVPRVRNPFALASYQGSSTWPLNS